ncbi:MAG: hypothetical protein K2R98_08995 [Gemmataceae bacterium]|nr:hypothetical protein [Gemmataceae bacterium]
MTQVVDQISAAPVETSDLVAAIQRVLQQSEEPLTVAKIRSQLPTALRTQNVEEVLQRQVSAKAVHEYPKYRSQHARYWDRPMPVHIAALLRELLTEEALAWSDLRRKLPAYAVESGAETILQEQLSQGRLHRHPRATARGGERFGAQKPDPKEYLRTELITVFGKLERMGFTQPQLRAGAIELLHEEEWASLPAPDQVPPPPNPQAAAAVAPAASSTSSHG